MSKKMDYKQKMECVDYMEQHLWVARCQLPKLGPNGKKIYDSKFKVLSEKLNASGNFKYNFTEWQKLWTELRLEARKKLNEYLKAMGKTGNRNMSVPEPDLLDLRICAIFGKDGLGQEIRPEVGLTVDLKDVNTSQAPNPERKPLMLFHTLSKKYPEVILNPIFPHNVWEQASEASKGSGFHKTNEEWFWFWKNTKENTEKKILMLELAPTLKFSYEELFVTEIIKEAERVCKSQRSQEPSKVLVATFPPPQLPATVKCSRRKRLSVEHKHNITVKQKIVKFVIRETTKSHNLFIQNMKDGFDELTKNINQLLQIHKF